MILTPSPSPARPSHGTLPPARPERATHEPVLLVHGTFANQALPAGLQWWQPGSDYCRTLDELLRAADSNARCWAHLAAATPFAWTGENLESARRSGGRALGQAIEALEADPRIERYHVVAHSHGGNVVVNALRELRGKPAKLGAVVYMGTPFLSFRHAEPIDTRWISVPMFVAAIVGCVFWFRTAKEYEVSSGITIVVLLLALVAEFVYTERRARRTEAEFYGSGVPRAFTFEGDEAISGLMSAQHIVTHPRTFVDQFVQSAPPPKRAVEPPDVPEPGLEDGARQSGVHALLDLLRDPPPGLQYGLAGVTGSRLADEPARRIGARWRTGSSFVEQLLANLPAKGFVVALLWACLWLPRWSVAIVATIWAVLRGLVTNVFLWMLFGLAKLAVRLGMPPLIRRAAFGADLGSFARVEPLPPGVRQAEPMSDELKSGGSAISHRLGGLAGQAALDAIVRKDAFAIKAWMETALSDASLLHSHYYQAAEVTAATARLIAGPRGREPAKTPVP